MKTPTYGTSLTAHERFKKNSSVTWPIGFIVAVGVHFGLFNLFPGVEAAPVAPVAASTLEAVELPPAVKVPAPPATIARPATPRVATVAVSEEITIAPITFEASPVQQLGAPPAPRSGPGDRPRFIPYTEAPRLKNPEEVVATLEREYPRKLRQAGIAGVVQLWLHISVEGRVRDTRIAESSGSRELDEAARRVAGKMVFSPAKNRDKVTAVWISQPIRFSVVGARASR